MKKFLRILSISIKFIAEHSILVNIIYKSMLDAIYYFFITEQVAYITGPKDPVFIKYIIGWFFFFILDYSSRRIKNQDMGFCFRFLMVLSAFPSISVYWVRNSNTICFFFIMFFWIILAWILKLIPAKQKDIKQSEDQKNIFPSSKNPVVVLCFMFLCISTLYFSYKYGKFRLFVSFSSVYDYRMDTSNYMNAWESYIFSWNTNLLLPLLLIIHLNNKKIFFVITDVMAGLMSYSIFGNKFVVFQIIYVIGIWIINILHLGKYVNNVITFVITLVSLFSIILRNNGIGRWGLGLLYRLLFIPTEAHNYYYDFFQTNPILYLRQSFLRHLFKDPYDNPVSVIIGSSEKYNLTSNYNNLNNGLFSDAYSNFGIYGIIIYPIVLAMILTVYSKSMKKYDATFSNVLLATYLGQIMSASLAQSLVTGGLLIGLIIIFFIQNSKGKILFYSDR